MDSPYYILNKQNKILANAHAARLICEICKNEFEVLLYAWGAICFKTTCIELFVNKDQF